MIIVIFGPQGSGKGSQSELLARKTGMFAFSMGDALRNEVKMNTEIGRKIRDVMARGELVPEQITNELIVKAVNSPEASKGIIIDGYPRDEKQLLFYSHNFKTDYAFELIVSEEVSINRISTRRVCPDCGRTYNIITKKPITEGKCDLCGTELIQRADDKPDAIRKRLEIYKKEMLPIKKYYENLGVLHVINAEGTIEEVDKKICEILKL